jgi:hypothetical protein
VYNSIQYSIDAETSDVISGIKNKIITLAIAGVTNKDNIELQFNGNVLLDNETLTYYNIQKNDTIDMTYVLPPAPAPAPVPAPVLFSSSTSWPSRNNYLIPLGILVPVSLLVWVLLNKKLQSSVYKMSTP